MYGYRALWNTRNLPSTRTSMLEGWTSPSSIGVDDDPAGGDLRLDRAVAEHHGAAESSPPGRGPKACRPCRRYVRHGDGDLRRTAEPPGQARGAAERQDDRGRLLRRPRRPGRRRRAAPRSSTSARTATRCSSTRRSGARSTGCAGRSPCAAPTASGCHTGVYDQDTVERFDEELDRGTDNLVDDLKRLIRANMEEEIERFSKALVENHILPEDF